MNPIKQFNVLVNQFSRYHFLKTHNRCTDFKAVIITQRPPLKTDLKMLFLRSISAMADEKILLGSLNVRLN
jgi:hypothetical protein